MSLKSFGTLLALAGLAGFGSSVPVRAEVLWLDDGRTVVGEIIEETEAYVELYRDGASVLYTRGEIEKIDRSVSQALPAEEPQAPKAAVFAPSASGGKPRKVLDREQSPPPLLK